jgi:toxin ParE1/3/4
VSRYLLSPAAAADLEEIWDYSRDRWSIEQADEYLRELQRAVERAAASPRIGHPIDEIRKSYLKLSAGSHVLFYRTIEPDGIEVVRVLHQRMDPYRHL